MLAGAPTVTARLIAGVRAAAAPASAGMMTSPVRTPETTPAHAINAPPASGATAIGTRLSIDWSVKPIARRSFGSASPMTAKMAGLAMPAQLIERARPTKTYGHEGLSK
jgi:hypothetical protein